jgi:hypothetical protein
MVSAHLDRRLEVLPWRPRPFGRSSSCRTRRRACRAAARRRAPTPPGMSSRCPCRCRSCSPGRARSSRRVSSPKPVTAVASTRSTPTDHFRVAPPPRGWSILFTKNASARRPAEAPRPGDWRPAQAGPERPPQCRGCHLSWALGALAPNAGLVSTARRYQPLTGRGFVAATNFQPVLPIWRTE